jgi:nicotinamide-nucleotide amidase
MLGEIIAIGDELTTGRILNTNSRFVASQLFAAGHDVVAMATIGDTADEIGTALKRALRRAEFVIITGGLGATTDDLTNEAVAAALGRSTVLFPEVLVKIKNVSGASNNLEKLAWLPEGAEVLKPEARMAGHLLVHDKTPLFFLPGVPHEMQELMVERVIPYLAAWQGDSARHVLQRVYKTFGLRETDINQKLEHLEKSDPRLRIGYYPVFPDVHICLTVIDEQNDGSRLFQEASVEIESLLGDSVYGADDQTMESVVGELLLKKKKMLAIAESCTGGLCSHKITRVPGSSAYFVGGVVSYSNELKEDFLGVSRETLSTFGAVSEETAREMATGIRTKTGSDIAIAITGIAGPAGGTVEKPVGTVCFGLATSEDIKSCRLQFHGNRWKIQEVAAQTALDLIRRELYMKVP